MTPENYLGDFNKISLGVPNIKILKFQSKVALASLVSEKVTAAEILFVMQQFFVAFLPTKKVTIHPTGLQCHLPLRQTSLALMLKRRQIRRFEPDG